MCVEGCVSVASESVAREACARTSRNGVWRYGLAIWGMFHPRFGAD